MPVEGSYAAAPAGRSGQPNDGNRCVAIPRRCELNVSNRPIFDTRSPNSSPRSNRSNRRVLIFPSRTLKHAMPGAAGPRCSGC
jgi:hypothetical protein